MFVCISPCQFSTQNAQKLGNFLFRMLLPVVSGESMDPGESMTVFGVK